MSPTPDRECAPTVETLDEAPEYAPHPLPVPDAWPKDRVTYYEVTPPGGSYPGWLVVRVRSAVLSSEWSGWLVMTIPWAEGRVPQSHHLDGPGFRLDWIVEGIAQIDPSAVLSATVVAHEAALPLRHLLAETVGRARAPGDPIVA